MSSFSCVSWACKLRQLCRRDWLVCDCELLQASVFESCFELPTAPVQCNDLDAHETGACPVLSRVPTQSCHCMLANPAVTGAQAAVMPGQGT